MFTGIVRYIEPIIKIRRINSNLIFSIKKPKQIKMQVGDSIAVNGICSTVIEINKNNFCVEYMPQTLNVTNIRTLSNNKYVNLEPCLRLNSFVDGHLILGHIDCIGIIKNIKENNNSWILTIKYPIKYEKYLIEKGSISIDGISLTTFAVNNKLFKVSIIPHTYLNTNIQYLKENDKVNLEFDVIGKYIYKICKLKLKK